MSTRFPSASNSGFYFHGVSVQDSGVLVNDVHSRLNPTAVAGVQSVTSSEELQRAVRTAVARGMAVSVAGGRHAMGGQQFGTHTMLIDTRPLARVLAFDEARGLIEVEAGIQWPALVDFLLRAQEGRATQWGIAQKQTGADRLSIGGAIAANVHGRGLAMRPFIADVESLTLVDARGDVLRCSRAQNAELFSLVFGGYGMFGIVATATLRLARRQKLRRVVEVTSVDRLMEQFDQRITAGFKYGDFQFAIDPQSPDFLRRGILSAYVPVDDGTPMPDAVRELSPDDWRTLLGLAHTDKSKAFDAYAAHYLSTDGQLYWSDTHQMTTYLDDYHAELDRKSGASQPASEMITELYVPRSRLADFLAEAAADFRSHGVDVIYGTVRLVERDDESFLPWARESYACTIFNLHVVHSPEGIARSASAFRRLIDMAVARGGSYYLTYHRHARREQIVACYPRFAQMLRMKRRYDPDERFQSDWYRHHRAMFDDEIGASRATSSRAFVVP